MPAHDPGSEPVSWLSCSSRDCILSSALKMAGRGPVRWLCDMSRDSRPVRLLQLKGMLPWKLLLDRSLRHKTAHGGLRLWVRPVTSGHSQQALHHVP